MKEPFESSDSVEKWLVEEREIPTSVAATVAKTLFDAGYVFSASLLNMPRADLDVLDMTRPHRNILFNKLQEQQHQSTEDYKTRFRRLAEEAAINVTDAMMKSILFHFSSQMTVVNTPSDAADLYRRASRIPRSATELCLREKNIAIASIFPGTDTTMSIILEAFEDGSPRLLKVTDTESINHEMSVWEEVVARVHPCRGLVPLKRLEFTKTAVIHVGTLSGGMRHLTEEHYSGILMEKYPSTLSRCKIPLTAEVLIRYGTQLKEAISILHSCGFCHMDIKPANVFISGGATCFLGDYGGATKVGEPVREHTVSYYPTDVGQYAKKETDYLLLIITLLEMFGAIPSPPSPMSVAEVASKVANLDDDTVKTFLNDLLILSSSARIH